MAKSWVRCDIVIMVMPIEFLDFQNANKGFYAQSYEDLDILDSAVLIMPMVFFCSAGDPRYVALQSIA
jgi:GH15 family glucan-1,4-alpha-glucosidase